MKKACITGITGQDGAYLAKLLISKGYRVFGSYRRVSSVDFWRLDELGVLGHPELKLVEHDITDLASTLRFVREAEPDEFYNLAAQSFVGVSFDQPITTTQITGLGAVNALEAIRLTNQAIRFYQASTSEMFGLVQEVPQREETSFYPRSPYGFSKLLAHWATVNYRESFGMFATSGILFNHESPLRGKEFVTRKITDSVARIAHTRNGLLSLGNLDAQRDWGFAEEYVEGMWRMLQTETPDTFVLATGKTTSVREFLRLAFAAANIDIHFEGSGENELGRDADTGRVVAQVRSEFFRPAEVDFLLGDAAKAKKVLGWEPKTSVEQLAGLMVQADLDRHKRGSSR